MNHRLEILAPAGDEEMLRAAVFSGADCVYVGVKGFNARRGAANFDDDQLARAVAFCHGRGCKVYAAINTLAFPGREKALHRAVAAAAAAGCDGVIVQDLLAAAMAQRIAPWMAVHASTQMSIHSAAGVRQMAEMGFSRVILGRELSLAEIGEIAADSPIELEVFVHGALCVSVSGQCYASAFLGGRSANRGGCAGTCRLPFSAGRGAAPAQGRSAAEDENALSLKDLSVLDALPRLQALGVASAKIEGRLRGPEYVAVAVDSALKAREGQSYDRTLLQGVFSRSGFTDGWFSGKRGADMFGVRTGEDLDKAKKALPKARELYRRERPRVPVTMALTLNEGGGSLTVGDGSATLSLPVEGPLPPAQKDVANSLKQALAKTGGTPFYTTAVTVEAEGVFYPTSGASALRKEALEQLLALRSAGGARQPLPPPAEGWHPAALPAALPQKAQPDSTAPRPMLRARFEHLAQLPQNAAELCGALVLPLEEAAQVPQALRHKCWLWLPRLLFGQREKQVAEAIRQTKDMGFAGYEAANLAHLNLCRGLPLAAAFGLNITNHYALEELAAEGCLWATLSPELSLAQMRQLVAGKRPPILTDALCYGHFPLMVTRACPLKGSTGCGNCKGSGYLADRKGYAFPFLCRGGVRQLYNPVPLWMADQLEQVPVDTKTLYFTIESREEAALVVEAFNSGEKAPATFTRGLYKSGTEA